MQLSRYVAIMAQALQNNIIIEQFIVFERLVYYGLKEKWQDDS